MGKLKELGIYNYQQVPQSKCRALKPSYFKLKEVSRTVSRLNTRIVKLNGVEFDHLKV